MTTRREWLSSLGAVAAGGCAAGLNAALGAGEANNPAANVADRTTTIKITRLTATPVMRKVFLKIETNCGVTGWGEIDQLEPFVAATLARSLFELLGGPSRDKLWFYPTPTATKIGAGPQPFSGTPQQIEAIVKNVENARKKVGPDGIVMFDSHCALPPPFLIQLASAIKPYDLLYIEEPAVPGNIEVFKRLKEQINIPLAVGEQARTIWDVIGYLHEGCADILEVDCAHTGGITQLHKIAILGEAYHVPIAPHCVTTDLGATASLHCSAAIPFFLIHEYYPSISPPGLVRKNWSIAKDGYASLPEGTGLCCQVDEAKLAELAKTPGKPEWPTRGRMPDGSIADY